LITAFNKIPLSKRISVVFAAAFYLILALFFYLIEIRNGKEESENEIYLNYIEKKSSNISLKTDQKERKPNKTDIPKMQKKLPVLVNENYSEYLDDSVKIAYETEIIEELSDSSDIKDSLLIQNPTFIALRFALKEHLNQHGIQKSEKAELIKKIEQSMQDYYKMKYPTSVHNFGDKGSGAGISIPIDKIIELFE
jgi:Tfp pilus assembly protein PilO